MLINAILKDIYYLFLGGYDSTMVETLANANTEILKSIFGSYKDVFIEEVQGVPIFVKTEIFVNQIKDVQVIISSSSAFEIIT